MKNFIYISLLSFFFASCESIIEVEIPKEDPKIVVNSYFEPDSTWIIYLSENQYILDDGPLKNITNASVSIAGSDGSSIQLTHTEDGIYVSNNKPSQNVTYTVTASASGYTTVSGSNTVPQAVEIVKVDTSTIIKNGISSLQMAINFNDPAGQSNYYKISATAIIQSYTYDIFGNIVDSVESQTELAFKINDLIFNEERDVIKPNWVFTDEFLSGRNYTLVAEFDAGVLGYNPGYSNLKSVTIHFTSMSYDYYRYLKSIDEYRQANGNPFAQPVQIFSNITNGRGIFAGSSTFSETIYFE